MLLFCLRGPLLLCAIVGAIQWAVDAIVSCRRASVRDVGGAHVLTAASCAAASAGARHVLAHLRWFERHCGIQAVAFIDAAELGKELDLFRRTAGRWASPVVAVTAACPVVYYVFEERVLLAAVCCVAAVANGVLLIALACSAIPDEDAIAPTLRYAVAPARSLVHAPDHAMRSSTRLLVDSVEFSDAYVLLRSNARATVPGTPLRAEPTGTSPSCIVCYDYARTHACRVCGNLGLCSDCVARLEHCPLCAAAGDFIRIFHP